MGKRQLATTVQDSPSKQAKMGAEVERDQGLAAVSVLTTPVTTSQRPLLTSVVFIPRSHNHPMNVLWRPGT